MLGARLGNPALVVLVPRHRPEGGDADGRANGILRKSRSEPLGGENPNANREKAHKTKSHRHETGVFGQITLLIH